MPLVRLENHLHSQRNRIYLEHREYVCVRRKLENGQTKRTTQSKTRGGFDKKNYNERQRKRFVDFDSWKNLVVELIKLNARHTKRNEWEKERERVRARKWKKGRGQEKLQKARELGNERDLKSMEDGEAKSGRRGGLEIVRVVPWSCRRRNLFLFWFLSVILRLLSHCRNIFFYIGYKFCKLYKKFALVRRTKKKTSIAQLFFKWIPLTFVVYFNVSLYKAFSGNSAFNKDLFKWVRLKVYFFLFHHALPFLYSLCLSSSFRLASLLSSHSHFA